MDVWTLLKQQCWFTHRFVFYQKPYIKHKEHTPVVRLEWFKNDLKETNMEKIK